MVAGIIGAIGNNGSGIAGANWIASIVPMSATSLNDASGANAFIADVSFISAAIYAEQEGIDIVNTSMGWQVASENANRDCADRKRQTTTGVPQSQFDNGNTTAQNAFRMPPWTDAMGNPTSRVLYVFSGGNSQLNLADPNIVHVPKEPLQAVIPQNVLIVGATRSSTQNSDYSCYGAPVVNIWAPGDAWRSLQPGGGTTTGDGTSFASPAVAGIAGLVLAADPTLVGNPAGPQSKLISRAATTVNVDVGCGVAETNRPWVDATPRSFRKISGGERQETGGGVHDEDVADDGRDHAVAGRGPRGLRQDAEPDPLHRRDRHHHVQDGRDLLVDSRRRRLLLCDGLPGRRGVRGRFDVQGGRRQQLPDLPEPGRHLRVSRARARRRPPPAEPVRVLRRRRPSGRRA